VANVLPLGGDGDELDLLAAVEKSFGIRFGKAEAEGWQTVGDLYATLLSKVRHVEAGPTPCQTAIAFRRLRHALEKANAAGRIHPRDELTALIRRRGAKTWRASRLKQGCAYRL
jgi:hypothetical protein